MKTKAVPSSWLHRDGRRFDCGPYTSGALEAKIRLEELDCRKDRLCEVTTGGMSGLVNPGRIRRMWVSDTAYGKPFLSSTDILQSDLSAVRYISNRAVAENPKLLIKSGWTLITRAGTIGRMCFARPDMDSMACTEDVLRVIPDEAVIPPGYLYAFLSGKFGVPIVTSGTYGAIIQHIEPQHLADLPVPRLGNAIEQRAHDLIVEAAGLRAEASAIRRRLIAGIESELGWDGRPLYAGVGLTSSRLLQRRLDAFHHASSVIAARAALSVAESVRLGDVASEVFEPNRGARRKVDDPLYGIPFLSSSEVFRLDPLGEYLISRTKTPHLQANIQAVRVGVRRGGIA